MEAIYPKQIAAAKFKEQALKLLDQVDEEGLIITKHGVPVAKLVAYQKSPQDLIGSLQGKLKIEGEILSTGLVWNAQP